MTLSVDVQLRLGQLDLNIAFDVGSGEVLAVLGPNGAGKTTLLRALAGLVETGSGSIVLDDVVLYGSGPPASDKRVVLAPEQRPIGMLFQDYLLFPHMNAMENVAFGPRARGVPKATAEAKALGWLERVGLTACAASKPRALSGGQAQRVALARALAADPKLLLLDEPLSALDASSRTTTRRDLRRHLADFDGSTVLVTHDPLDALSLADKVLILEAGRVTQMGSLAEVTARPRTAYVAELLGVNLLRGVANGREVVLVSAAEEAMAGGVLADRAEGPHDIPLERSAPVSLAIGEAYTGEVLAVFRPRAVALHRSRPETSARNVWDCRVVGFDLLGDHVKVRLSGALDLIAEVTPESVVDMGLAEGERVWASVKATDIDAYPS
ncbi:MAG: ABC transporter ATP-binding protein [Microthrixaceae bacterium]